MLAALCVGDLFVCAVILFRVESYFNCFKLRPVEFLCSKPFICNLV